MKHLKGPITYHILATGNELEQSMSIANERQIPGEENKQDNTTTPHINRLRIRPPQHNLRAHVIWRTDTTRNNTSANRSLACRFIAGVSVWVVVVCVRQLDGDAEATKFDRRRVLFAREQHAMRLDVAVDAFRYGVTVAHRFQDLSHVVASHRLRVNEACHCSLLDLEA